MVRRPPASTHTIEMAQIKEINAKLKGRSGVVITAGELPLEAQPGDRIGLWIRRRGSQSCR